MTSLPQLDVVESSRIVSSIDQNEHSSTPESFSEQVRFLVLMANATDDVAYINRLDLFQVIPVLPLNCMPGNILNLLS